MRYFIALDLSEKNKQQLVNVQQELRKIIPTIRLTDNDKLHLTIAFIGEQDSGIQAKLEEIILRVSKDISPFIVTPSYIDAFPNIHHPQVLWLGVKGDLDKLHLLRERIKDGLLELGLEVDERRYTPHIAIAKINEDFTLSSTQEEKLQQIQSNELEPIQVISIKLFESIPNHGFHTHNTLAVVNLIAP